MTKLVDLPTAEHMLPGNRACAGCAVGIGLRAILKALDGKAVMTVPASCLTVIGGMYPVSSVTVPWLNVAFPATAAAASGLAAGLRATGRAGEMTVLAMAGDGGTADIGIQALSGAAERNEDFIYVCYDNEGYMNTGVQRSAATPPAARTATTDAVGPEPGNVFGQGKDLPRIAMAHDIAYVATATVADLHDLEHKVEHAMTLRGARYIHILVPCPLGWGSASSDTIKVARLAKESGLFPVFEAENGRVTSVSPIRRRTPVEEYLRLQRRYAHLFGAHPRPDIVTRLQEIADENIARYGLVNDETEEIPVLEEAKEMVH